MSRVVVDRLLTDYDIISIFNFILRHTNRVPINYRKLL